MSTETSATGGVALLNRHVERAVELAAGSETAATQHAKGQLGDRPRLSFEAALYVTATNSGFPSWTAFRKHLETLTPERTVDRAGREGVELYERRARELAEGVSKGDEKALKRARYNLAKAEVRTDKELTNIGISEIDALNIVAREWGYPDYPQMQAMMTNCFVQSRVDKYINPVPFRTALEAIQRGNPERLGQVLTKAPEVATMKLLPDNNLLAMLAQPDGPTRGEPVDDEVVRALVDAGADTDQPLSFAAAFNRVDLVRQLLELGATVADGVTHWDINALESGVLHGSADAVDAIVNAHGLVPDAFWLAAGAGRVRDVEKWFDGDGNLVPEAGWHRSDFSSIGMEPGDPQTDDAEEVLAEAFTHAVRNDRREVVELLLKRGADVNRAVYRGVTPLHHAVWTNKPSMVSFLLENKADREARDEIYNSTPAEWGKELAEGNVISAEVRDLVGR